jgi:hypothetical protein
MFACIYIYTHTNTYFNTYLVHMNFHIMYICINTYRHIHPHILIHTQKSERHATLSSSLPDEGNTPDQARMHSYTQTHTHAYAFTCRHPTLRSLGKAAHTMTREQALTCGRTPWISWSLSLSAS